MFDNLEDFFESIFSTTEQIDVDLCGDEDPRERFSTNKAFSILIDGDFDYLRLFSNNFNTLLLQQIPSGVLAGTKKMPTWLAITISVKASLFNFKFKHYMDTGLFYVENISDTDYVNILSYTYIDLSRAKWNQQNTTPSV